MGIAITPSMITETKKSTCQATKKILRESYIRDINALTTAKGYLVYDFTATQELFSKNPDTPFPLASLTKLMTVHVERTSEPKHLLYSLTHEDIATEGDSGLAEGQTFTLYDLERLALVASSNDAATGLSHSIDISESTFIQKMNEVAHEMGLDSLSFTSVTGLDTKEGAPTALGSSRDILTLLHTDIQKYPELLQQTSVREITITPLKSKELITVKNTNRMIPAVPLFQAGKTGYTVAAGGNLAIVWTDRTTGHTLGAVLLGETEEGRFNAMISITEKVASFINQLHTNYLPCIQ